MLAPGARAARLPDWAKPIADAAPPVAEGVSKHPSRVLFKEMRYAVQPDGAMKVRYRFASQALSARDSDEVGLGYFTLEGTMKAGASKAWHVPPGERAERSWMPPVDVSVSPHFLDNTKARVLMMEGVKKGSLVFFEFEAMDTPWILPITYVFYDPAPVAVSRLQIETPPGWESTWVWLRRPGLDPTSQGALRTWELRDLPAPEEVEMGVPPREEAPMLAVGLKPPAGAQVKPAAFDDWAGFSSWYEDLVRGRDAASPQIEAIARDAAAAPAGFFETVRSAGRYVRDKVRYVAVELGIGGMQPRPAAETLADLYGDCKDKGTLFRSVLGAAGIPSHPVLVNLGEDGTVTEEVASDGFNHFIVAVPVPPGEAVPPSFAAAVTDAGDLGRLLFVDTTDEWTSIGSLSADLAGHKGLVVAGPKGRLVQLPAASASSHTLVRRFRVELRPDRSVGVERTSTYLGEFAWEARRRYSASVADRRKAIEGRILDLWPDAAVDHFAADSETPEGAYVETIRFRRRPLPPGGPDAKVAVFPGAADDLERVPLGKRRTAVDYEHPRTIRYETEFTGLPDSAGLPAGQSQSAEGWSVATTYAREGGVLRAAWEATLTRTRFDPEAFAELRRFWSAAASSAGWTVAVP